MSFRSSPLEGSSLAQPAGEATSGSSEPPTAQQGHTSTPGMVRRRLPELAVGVVLIGLGAIGALALADRQPPRAEVLIWANDVARGQQVAPSDLSVASIDSDTPVDVVEASAAGEVVGRTVAFDVPVGGFVSSSLLQVRSVIPDEFAVVGLRLGAGSYPVSSLSVGDVVDLVTTEPLVGWEDPVVVAAAEVFDVLWLGSGEGSDALVSLLVPRALVPRVAAAAEAGPRLAEVAS